MIWRSNSAITESLKIYYFSDSIITDSEHLIGINKITFLKTKNEVFKSLMNIFFSIEFWFDVLIYHMI